MESLLWEDPDFPAEDSSIYYKEPPSVWPDISCSHICVVSLFLRLRVWTMAPCGRTQTSLRRTAPSITRTLPQCGLTSHAPISVLSLCSPGCVSGRWLPVGGPRLPGGGQLHLLQGSSLSVAGHLMLPYLCCLSVPQAACLDDGSLWEDPDFPAEDSSIYYKEPPSVWPDISCSHICVVSLFPRPSVWTMALCGRTQTSPRRTAPSITRSLPQCGRTSHAPISVLSLCSSGCVSGRWLSVGGQLHLLQGSSLSVAGHLMLPYLCCLSVPQAACLDDGSLWEDPDFPAEDSSIYYKEPPSVWPDISCSHICVVSLFLRLRVWTMAPCGRTQTSPQRTAPSITRSLPQCGRTSHAPISVLSLCSSGCVSGRWLPVGGPRLPCRGQLHLLQGPSLSVA